MASTYAEQRREIETRYRDWLIDTDRFKELPKEKNAASAKPPVRAFRGLEID
jgi:hypothetical protein